MHILQLISFDVVTLRVKEPRDRQKKSTVRYQQQAIRGRDRELDRGRIFRSQDRCCDHGHDFETTSLWVTLPKNHHHLSSFLLIFQRETTQHRRTWWSITSDVLLTALSGRRVPKSHSSRCCSCCCYQFSKNPQGFVNTQRSATKLCTHIRAHGIPYTELPSQIFKVISN